MGEARRKPPGDIIGDVLSAKRNDIGEDELSFVENRNARRPRTHFQIARSEHRFIVDENRARSGIRRNDIIGDVEVAAPHRQPQVVERPRFDRHRVYIYRQCLAEHAERLSHPVRIVYVILHRCGVQHDAPSGIEFLKRRRYRPLRIHRSDVVCHDPGFPGVGLATRPAARHADDHFADRSSRHALRGIDREPDGPIRVLDVHDDPGFHPPGSLVPETAYLQFAGPFCRVPRLHGFRDQAADLSRADVERGDDVRIIRRPRTLAVTFAWIQSYHAHDTPRPITPGR